MNYYEIGNRIAHCRKMCGYSQSYVAEKASIDQSYYSKIEHGLHIPLFKTLYSIACVLGVSVDYLFGRENTIDDVCSIQYHVFSLCDVCRVKALGLICPADKNDCTYYSDSTVRTCPFFTLNCEFLKVDVTDGFKEDK